LNTLTILEHADILEDFNSVSFEEWQAKRQKQVGIGGSDAGTLLGLNSFKDEYTLYLEKIGELEPSVAGEAAEWGHELEPIVANKWVERHGKGLGLEIEHFNYLLGSKEYPFMLANIDRLIRKGDSFGILEVKTASEYLNGEWQHGEILADGTGSGKVPEKYYAQLQHYFAVTGLEWGYFASLVGGNKLYSVYVERNEAYIQKLIEIELLFSQRLEMRIPPEINGSETCKQLIGTLFPEPNDEFVEVIEDSFGEWIYRRDALKEEIGLLENQLNEVETNIKNLIADNKGALWNGYKVTWGWRAGKKTVDQNILKDKYPDIYTEVLTEGKGYRQLSVAKPKTKKIKGA
jgi:putative phage-type endonuclease